MGIDSLAIAEEDFNNCLNHDPLFAEAYVNLAIIQIAKENYSEAERSLDRARNINPDYAYAIYLAGNIKLIRGDINGAIDLYDRAGEIDTEFFQVHFNKGILYLYEDKGKKAVDEFTVALRLCKDPVPLLLLRGIAYININKPELAINDWQAGWEYDSSSLTCLMYKGYAHVYLKEYDVGLENIIQAIIIAAEKDKKDKGVRRLLSQAASIKQIEINQALLHFYEERALYSVEDKRLISEAIVLYLLEDYGKCLRTLEKIKKKTSDYSSVYWISALCNFMLTNREDAIKDYNEVIRLEPNNEEIYIELVLLNDRLKNPMGSVLNLSQLIRLNPEEAIYYARRGKLWIELGKYQNALLDFGESLKRDSTQIDLIDDQALAFQKLGNYTKAAEQYRLAHELRPSNVDLLISYCEMLYASGDTIGSLAMLDKYLFEQNSGNRKVIETRANLYLIMGENEMAISEFDYLIKNGYNREDNYLKLLTCYLKSEHWESVITLGTDYINKSKLSDNAESYIHYCLGIAYYNTNDNDAGCLYLKKAVKNGYGVPPEDMDKVCSGN